MVIAVDAVGGDHFPQIPVAGAIRALEENPELEILLVGPKELIESELQKHNDHRERIDILHAPEIIGMDDSPSVAVKSKQNSSIALGLAAHKDNKCDAFVSAGNTGALLAASTFLLGKLPGVTRPTIAATYPTLKGISLLVDAGANLELKPEMYLQFAKMCTIFAREIMGIDTPTVGLLNVGEEPEKGLDIHKEVYKLLSGLDNFSGNVEGKDIFLGKTDIYLTDGFTGNLILKFGESISSTLQTLTAQVMEEKKMVASEREIVQQVLSKAMHSFDYENVGGIPFLGVNGLSLVGHGGSSEKALKNMIVNALQCKEHKINEKIVASLNN